MKDISEMGKKKRDLFENPVFVLIIAVFAVFMGVVLICGSASDRPIEKDEAVAASGSFDHYDTETDYRVICMEDGSCYFVYPNGETDEFCNRMLSLEKGTKVELLVNPNNDYVLSVVADGEELMSFEEGQGGFNFFGFMLLGLFCCAVGVFFIAFLIMSDTYKKGEAKRHAERTEDVMRLPLREAEDVPGKVLLEFSDDNLNICYRRVKRTNELIVNGMVYDEKKGLWEFSHKLTAIVNGRSVVAGFDSRGFSYILIDDELKKTKKRLI